jgi:hypothetical protein
MGAVDDDTNSTAAVSGRETAPMIDRIDLAVIGGPDAGKTFSATGKRVVVGTGESADLVLTDPTVSRFQSEVALPRRRALDVEAVQPARREEHELTGEHGHVRGRCAGARTRCIARPHPQRFAARRRARDGLARANAGHVSRLVRWLRGRVSRLRSLRGNVGCRSTDSHLQARYRRRCAAGSRLLEWHRRRLDREGRLRGALA